MALVKVIGIKDKPKETIKYVENKDKTLNGDLVSGINTLTDVDISNNKMKYYRDRYQVNNKVKTFHIVHSFSNKEELTPEQAHEISLEWFKKMFPNTAIAIAATHTDTNTLHTHFLVNNVTLDGIKIRTDKEWIKRSIEISNEICKAHGLKYSIIENKKMIPNKSWYEYQQEKLGQSWKQKIRDDIDKLIVKAQDIEHLYSLLAEEGYELKTDRKYVAIRPEGKERFVRLKTLGYNYSVEQLKNRILGLSEYDLDGIGYRNYKNNKWIDKDVYKYKFKKASIGTIIQLTGKIIATQLGVYSNDKRYIRHNYKAEKELEVIEKALNIIQDNNFETREDVVKAYNELENELRKIHQWKSKAQKKIEDVNLLAEEINKIDKQIKMVENKEKECCVKQNEFKTILGVYDKCRHKEYEKIYKSNDIKPGR